MQYLSRCEISFAKVETQAVHHLKKELVTDLPLNTTSTGFPTMVLPHQTGAFNMCLFETDFVLEGCARKL